jgi:glutathione S-transferase
LGRYRVCNLEPMTLRIERVSAQGRTVVRLIGRVQSDCLAEIEAQIEGAKPRPALDLEEVTLVDVRAVRFLSVCEQSGIELLHCAPYIRHWMAGERPGQGDGRGGRGKAERKE